MHEQQRGQTKEINEIRDCNALVGIKGLCNEVIKQRKDRVISFQLYVAHCFCVHHTAVDHEWSPRGFIS
jgi:hypothetical protein